ncbi:FHA domain-containing protein [Rhodovulum sp. ES.010]|uniref:FHA domain-containing protein n=1 Tax=Rhodovulum sp. ES.010 TaxID=1882821 RepID=UPI00092923BF|nr:FHA domain-containing protein [Rhodovulum sp. ES.010]SIO40575.1 FHA domain-containing protein [Rhodovulum sp. ES.010]
MRFLKRKDGAPEAESDFDDYVPPFPPPAPAPARTHPREDSLRDAPGLHDLPRQPGADTRADTRPEEAAPTVERDPAGIGEDDDMIWDYGDDAADAADRTAPPGDTPIFPSAPATPAQRRRPTAAETEERRMAMFQSTPPPPADTAQETPPRRSGAARPDEDRFELTPPPAAETEIAVPPPSAGRAGAQGGRAKTRLLGFGQPAEGAGDPFADPAGGRNAASAAQRFPVGWLVVIEGPGRGAHFTLYTGVSQIGRGEDQAIRLDFGDTSISRSGHALVAFDDEQTKFFLGSGGKVNIVRLNGQPLLSTEELTHDDTIRIGETKLRFVAFCGPDFSWSAGTPDDDGR